VGALDALGLPSCLGGLHGRLAGGVKARLEDGSVRNAGVGGLLGAQHLRVRGSGAGIWRSTGAPVGGAEKSAGSEGLGIGACSCWALLLLGRVVMAVLQQQKGE